MKTRGRSHLYCHHIYMYPTRVPSMLKLSAAAGSAVNYLAGYAVEAERGGVLTVLPPLLPS